jgi:hypothetical protein
MLLEKHQKRLGGLEERLRHARTLTPDLMSHVIATAYTRFAVHGPAAKAKVDQLIRSGALDRRHACIGRAWASLEGWPLGSFRSSSSLPRQGRIAPLDDGIDRCRC